MPNSSGLCLAFAVLLPFSGTAEVVCALGSTASSYNAYQDQRPSPDAMELAGQVNAALTPICRPNCPVIAVFRNTTAANAMLIAAPNGDAKIVYAPQFFTTIYEAYGAGAVLSIIAHELGHALSETAAVAWMKGNWSPEQRADAWAGCVLGKLNLTGRALQESLTALSKYPSPAHPGWSERVSALHVGYAQCGGDGGQFDKSVVAAKQK